MNLKRLFVAVMMLLFVTQTNAQDKTVSGKVTDATGAAVSGATIKVKGKAIGKTNADGTFSVKTAANSSLEFTSVGFTTMEMQVPASGAMSVSLKASNDNLNEVVVIGYGTAKKRDLTGAVATVSSKDFVKGALTTPEQLIAGKVAGVSVTPNGGAPGSGSVIRIRGGASLNASNDPLIVIDGIPLDNNGISGSSNGLNLINPNDIETFNILKDASAAAIYGSRASNGVIIITTKRGKSGKPTFNFSSITSVYTPSGKISVLSANQFRDYVKANGAKDDIARLGTANTDWQDEIYKTAIGSDNNISMTGSIGKNIPFRASLGYLNQNGILRGGSLKRSSAAINISPKFFKDHLKIDVNLKGVVSENQFANEGAIGSAVTFDPTQPVYSGTQQYGGYWQWKDAGSETGLNALAPRNPLGLLKQFNNKGHVERSIGNIQFDYKFHKLPELRAVVNLGYDISKTTGVDIISDSAGSMYKRFKDSKDVRHGGRNNTYRQEKTNTVLDAYLNYTKETNAGRFDVLVGYSYQDFKAKNYNFNDYTFDSTIVSRPVFDFDIPRNLLISVYGRLNYSYKGKYMLTASARKDGSSRFAKSNRWGVFPSGAAAWRIKEESFLKNVKAINDLKLRVGYGITGQQDGIGNYDYFLTYNQSTNESQYQFGNQFYQLSAPAGYYAKRKWEQTAMFNLAADFALFNNRITGTLEYYNRTTKDLLNDATQSAGTNFNNKFIYNVGNMKNEGIEFTLNTGIVRKKELNWDLGFNITYNKNEITNLLLQEDPSYPGNIYGGISGGTDNRVLINAVGSPRGAFYVYKQVYDEKTGKAIDGLLDDRNRDGVIGDKDLRPYKQVDPVFILGLSSNVSYKKWSAGFVMRGNFGNYLYNNVESNTGVRRNIINPVGFLANGSSRITETGFKGNGSNYYLSDYYVENASFVRMDNINIGYNFGKVFNKNANLRLGLNVQNVFIITKYKGLDPEVSGGIDNNLYPRPRVFALSANLDF